MKFHFLLLFALSSLLFTACNNSVKSLLSKAQAGEAIIQNNQGKFSAPMSAKDAFAKLKSNEKLYLAKGRAILFEPIDLKNLKNVKIIGDQSELVAKIDMPVLTFNDSEDITLLNFTVVHEIGDICSQNCVEFYNAKNLNIKQCKFDGSGYFGLALSKVDAATITGNQFYNCEYGLAAWNCSNLTVKGNRFSKNRGQDVMMNGEEQFANDVKSENTFLD